ncbi:CobW family GTP-binding protein [Ancylobacter defluvii]|uniref:ATP-binding protein n=1 Tax=Ancylobacter defluvii TaxID=1282440 RepID=A0A9W6NAR3_9HYPH|nr:GTP-binding protein [Ancylobacter defluvii]MBS7589162.1 GTP-binding protein [Ancylobacter defluvii]GLK84774.1 ATP-binding protein [Ancylobacter defluvii]
MTIPVILITGFLGSGKTTLLNHLLRDPEMADSAVIINEFGDVAIDHLLVESAIENTVVLQSGCICCTVRGDLVDTLDDLCAKVARGELPAFSRVAIETTGLADPAALVRAFLTEPILAERFDLHAVVATVDAVNGAGQLDSFEEARHQAALADILVLTKSDLAAPAAIADLAARLKTINPGASLVPVVQGQIAPAALFAQVPAHPSRRSGDTLAWLNSEAFAASDSAGSHHDDGIRAFAVTLDRPVTRDALRGWLRSILSLRGVDLLRMKGIVALRGEAAPMVVHAVQQVMHPPVQLPAWPSDDHTTRLVFITRNMEPEALRGSLEVLVARAAA